MKNVKPEQVNWLVKDYIAESIRAGLREQENKKE